MPLVDNSAASKISLRRLIYLDSLFTQYLQKFDKSSLIAHIVWEREKFARSFFETYQGFDLAKFLTFNVLIKRLMSRTSFTGQLLANEKNTADLIDRFSGYVSIYHDHISLKSGFYSMIGVKPFDLEKMSKEELLKNFKIVPNETYLPVLETFESNDILREEEAQRKIEEYKSQFQPAMSQKKITYTPYEIIEKFYPTLNQLYCGLFRNTLFLRIFDFSYLKGHVTPSKMMDFVNQFPLVESYPTVAEVNDFLRRLEKSFPGMRPKIPEKMFVFSEKNSQIFPLFVALENHVFISHRTSFIIYLLLHPILYKDRFDPETQRRSREFEKREVAEKFRRTGFNYFPDLQDKKKKPTLQIDGIATRGDTMYVIECKGWGIKPLYDLRERQQYLERDLKGIVDGREYTTKNGKLEIKKKVSLLDKVRFAKENMEIWGFDPALFPDV